MIKGWTKYPIRRSTFNIALLLFEHGIHIAHAPIELVAMVHVSIKLLLQVSTSFLDGHHPSNWRIYGLKATLWSKFLLKSLLNVRQGANIL